MRIAGVGASAPKYIKIGFVLFYSKWYNKSKGGERMNAETLKQIREKNRLTQLEFAKLVGVSMMSYRLWEKGSSKPSDENMAKLQEVINQLEGVK